jgi:hypothetical protein
VAQAVSSFDFADSYDGDDAWRFHREWNAAIDRYSEATRQNGQLEFALNASQAALSAIEVEANVVRVQQSESNTRVTSEIFNVPVSFDGSVFTDLLKVSCVFRL